MPNWVTNELELVGEELKVKEVMDALSGVERKVTFKKVLPLPKALENTQAPTKETNEELIKLYGYDNWYDWQRNNWGSKWDACEGEILDDSNLVFQTAWATPFLFFKTLSEKFTDVEIIVRYSDEDFGYNVGTYTLKNGEVISETIPQGGSEEAYELAAEIQYGDITKWLRSEMEYIEDYDITDKFVISRLRLIVKHRVIPNEGVLSLEFLNELLELSRVLGVIGKSDFSYGDEIKKLITLAETN